MSIDKFIMRGMSGSLGSGGDGWIVKTSAQTAPAPTPPPSSSSGTSFVMGGGRSGRTPTTTQPSRGQGKEVGYRESEAGYRSYDRHASSEGDSDRKSYSKRRGYQPQFVSDGWRSTKAQRILTGLVFYGFFIFGLIYMLFTLFGDGKSEDFYTAPEGLSSHARPLWER